MFLQPWRQVKEGPAVCVTLPDSLSEVYSVWKAIACRSTFAGRALPPQGGAPHSWLLAEALAWGCTVAQAHKHQWRLHSVCCCGLQQQGVCMLMRCARGHFTCTHLLLFQPGVCVATSGPFWSLRCSFLWSGLRASQTSAEGPCCPQPQSRLFHAHISWHEVWSSCPSH